VRIVCPRPIAFSAARGTAAVLQEDGGITEFKVNCLLTVQGSSSDGSQLS
jgi:spore maturation protein SpmB